MPLGSNFVELPVCDGEVFANASCVEFVHTGEREGCVVVSMSSGRKFDVTGGIETVLDLETFEERA